MSSARQLKFELEMKMELSNQELLKIKCLGGEISFTEFREQIERSAEKTLILFINNETEKLNEQH